MSRGFVKEGDQEEPLMVPPRAALPEGATNYVTPEGLELLKKEMQELEKQRRNIEAENETEKRRTQAFIDGKMKLLSERIQTARLLNPEEQPENEVRFGAKVKVENLDNHQKQEFQIVGVDEANIRLKKIAFVAPIARAITGKKVGETAQLKLGTETRQLKILKVEY
ncbi:transcription elongation factor GreA [Christiangramia fulva]|uniref:Transcription elongation factor GreA n=1 Tax=Christiangramia fulva TaxID=2126553 RepID=A0A2R3Z7S6_9FLAO|nr:GreA/GreB family elongation factor [Christiangramia fulva]AVR46330.1 transcription elongation factor GreA [Christiangramia fulva]